MSFTYGRRWLTSLQLHFSKQSRQKGEDTLWSSRLGIRGRGLLPFAIGAVGSFQSNLQIVRAFHQSLSCAPPPIIMLRRQSVRLKQARTRSTFSNVESINEIDAAPMKKKSRKFACPLRTREAALEGHDVMGVDEAGRGPLAGPVVAAAALVPCTLEGVMDSKLLTKEEEREKMYQALIESPNIQYAVAIVDAARIDEINILQATLEAMRMAVDGVMNPKRGGKVCVSREGCYVVCGPKAKKHRKSNKYYALIDGNKVPKDMPCDAECIIKGDSKEFCIAAASILAKVTRDRLMRGYDELYPEFQLQQHKGYPTAKHMALVRKYGASPIHRRTFAPLKHMSFDEQGRILTDDS
jgi:ribonuclease HII